MLNLVAHLEFGRKHWVDFSGLFTGLRSLLI